MSMEDIDFLDVGTGILGVCVVASAPTPLIALPLVALWTVQHLGRRSKVMQDWSDSVTDRSRIAAKVMPLLLPPPGQTSTEVTLRQDAPLDVRVTNEPKKLSWGESITQRSTSKLVGTAEVKTTKVTAKQQQLNNMTEILAKMPKYISYDKTPDAPTKTSVLVGYDPALRKWMWIDFGLEGDTVHAFVAGQTGTGKDSELRLWFTQLTSNNTPEEIKFVVIDGKGEWLTPALLANPYMLIPPAGGVDLVKRDGKYVDKAEEDIESSLDKVFELISERSEAFRKVGATNIQTYERKTGKKLPILFIIATDVGTNFDGQLEKLIRFITFKSRSFGVRLIISMQTASGQDTGWRGQLAFTMSGFQQLPSADTPNMGIPVSALQYRPSQLPSPDDPKDRGIFVVRKGNQQHLIKAVHLPDSIFETYCENIADTTPHTPEYNLLGDLLATAPEIPKQRVKLPKKILTRDQIEQVIMLTRNGKTKTQIMHELGVTSGERYKEVSPVVDGLIALAKSKR